MGARGDRDERRSQRLIRLSDGAAQRAIVGGRGASAERRGVRVRKRIDGESETGLQRANVTPRYAIAVPVPSPRHATLIGLRARIGAAPWLSAITSVYCRA